MNIVQVQFKNRYGGGFYSANRYSYIAEVPVAVGDIVNVPTRNGPGEAKVIAVNVPESELPAWLTVDKLQRITEPAVVGDMCDGASERA